jgi:hypothetical protein
MQVSYTYDPRDKEEEDCYMVVATKSEWEQVMKNLDGIGHCDAVLDLLSGLKSWGMSK